MELSGIASGSSTIAQQQATPPEHCSVLMAAVSPTVQLAVWGSQGESSCQPDDLPSRLPSGSPEQGAATATSTSSRCSSSISTASSISPMQPHPAKQQQQQDWACAVSQAAAAAGQVVLVLPRGHAGGHRSMPGAPDLHPQEVLVKVSVQHRRHADSCAKFVDGCVQAQRRQQRVAEQQQQQQQQQQEEEDGGQQQEQDDQEETQQERASSLCRAATLPQLEQQAGFASTSRSSSSSQSQCPADQEDTEQPPQQQPVPPSGLQLAAPRGCAEDSPAARPARRQQVPVLDLSRAQLGKPVTVRAACEPQPLTRQQTDKDEELCLEHSSSRSVTLHPNAPMQDNRCYHYRAVPTKDVLAMQALLDRLEPSDAAQVRDIWDALLTARRDCEAMAARGVRVSRDISRDWQETVSDLIDRVVAQDNELGQLRQQLKEAKAATAAVASSTSAIAAASSLPGAAAASASDGNLQELHAQVVRLKRHRDKLLRELADARLELQGAHHRAAEAQGQLALSIHQQAQDLREQHVAMQQIQLAAYAEGLEAASAAYMQPQPPHPMSALTQPAALAGPGAQDVAWALAGSCQELGGAAGRDCSSSGLPYVAVGLAPGPHPKQQQQQPSIGAFLSRASRMQQQCSSSSSLPGSYAGQPHLGAGSVQAKAVSSSSRWLQSGLSSLAHLGRSHRHTDGPAGSYPAQQPHQQHAAAAAAVGAAGVAACGPAAQCPTTAATLEAAAAVLQATAAVSTAGGRGTPEAPAARSRAATPTTGLVSGLVISSKQSYHDSPQAVAAAGYYSEQMAAGAGGVTAAAAAGGVPGSQPSKRYVASCPGKVVLSHQVLAAHVAGGGGGPLAAAWSQDIPQHAAGPDLSPRPVAMMLGRCCHPAAGAAAGSLNPGAVSKAAAYQQHGCDYSGATSLTGTPHESAPPASSRHFDQQQQQHL